MYNFKFGRGLVNPCREFIDLYNRSDVMLSIRTISTVRPTHSVIHLLKNRSMGVEPLMGETFIRR